MSKVTQIELMKLSPYYLFHVSFTVASYLSIDSYTLRNAIWIFFSPLQFIRKMKAFWIASVFSKTPNGPNFSCLEKLPSIHILMTKLKNFGKKSSNFYRVPSFEIDELRNRLKSNQHPLLHSMCFVVLNYAHMMMD